MELDLTEVEVRVLAALVEKEGTTPEHYPLTLNGLLAACNQKSARDPVMSLGEDSVAVALDTLRQRGMLSQISGAGHRVQKYRHRLGEVFNFDRREQAVLCVLMLRGPQTVGELRGRTERLHDFDDLEAVEATLTRLMERTPPLATVLPRRPGEKEPRYMHLMAGEVEILDTPATAETVPARAGQPSAITERVRRLEEELAELRSEFQEFRKKFE